MAFNWKSSWMGCAPANSGVFLATRLLWPKTRWLEVLMSVLCIQQARTAWQSSSWPSPSSQRSNTGSTITRVLCHPLSSTSQADALCLLLSLLPGMPDGTLDTVCTEETGSEEDLYEELHNSGHHYSHPRGGGEQLAINEVVSRRFGQWKEGPSAGSCETHVQLCSKYVA